MLVEVVEVGDLSDVGEHHLAALSCHTSATIHKLALREASIVADDRSTKTSVARANDQDAKLKPIVDLVNERDRVAG